MIWEGKGGGRWGKSKITGGGQAGFYLCALIGLASHDRRGARKTGSQQGKKRGSGKSGRGKKEKSGKISGSNEEEVQNLYASKEVLGMLGGARRRRKRRGEKRKGNPTSS